jgi:transposase
MAIQNDQSMGFVDAALDGLNATRAAALLERLDAATPWETMSAPVRQLPEYNAPAPRAGHTAWRPVLMLKCLMLQKWFNLSDPGLEDALKDRVSFRRFVGLSFNGKTPDETTFVRFRARLREWGIHDAIFAAVVTHMDAQGLLVRQGTMVDAAIIKPRVDTNARTTRARGTRTPRSPPSTACRTTATRGTTRWTCRGS